MRRCDVFLLLRFRRTERDFGRLFSHLVAQLFSFYEHNYFVYKRHKVFDFHKGVWPTVVSTVQSMGISVFASINVSLALFTYCAANSTWGYPFFVQVNQNGLG